MTEEMTKETTPEAEPKQMDGAEFLELAQTIRGKILASEAFNGEGKTTTIEVLDGICRSIKLRGVKQHGLTKRKKQVALAVFVKLGEAEDNTLEEKAVYNALIQMLVVALR